MLEILKENVRLNVLYEVFCICVTFDVMTGVIKALKNKRLKSKTLRDGLFASIGELITLLLCMLSTSLIPITTSMVYTLMGFMILKELFSILENLVQIGVNFPTWLIKGLEVYAEKIDKGE